MHLKMYYSVAQTVLVYRYGSPLEEATPHGCCNRHFKKIKIKIKHKRIKIEEPSIVLVLVYTDFACSICILGYDSLSKVV